MHRREVTIAWGLVLLGLLVRIVGLPLWGTFDTEIWKAWSARAVDGGISSMYGPPDGVVLSQRPIHVQPLTFEWGTGRYTVDYPPGSLLVAWVAGKLYEGVDPDMHDRWRFNVAVNLSPLLASLGALVLLWKSSPGGDGRNRGLALWLNPAVLLAAPVLGYQDTVFCVMALAGILCLMEGRNAAAGALVVAAALVKPQGVLVLPTLLVILAKRREARGALLALGGGVAAAVAVLLPWWSQGYLLSALDGCLRTARQNTLSAMGLNVWWIAGWALQASRTGPLALAEIVNVDTFHHWAGFDPRLLSRALVLTATAANLWILARRPLTDRAAIPLSVVLEVHAYALLATSVHENHTLLAVMVAPLLLSSWDKARSCLAGTSLILFASLYLTAGFGRRVTALHTLRELRSSTGIDLSVLVALAHLALVVILFVWALRRPTEDPP